ncbi:MAG: fumarate hydratase [Candidatus Omnitrophica bacterium CG11_big_fil_rev_8_21_14_0_20_41_12]|nr:MAG: fumarate hydratase [Candidatus Omnitrophica bacterium CG11_big_fil_rev_8_21_14_0_20_41_12]
MREIKASQITKAVMELVRRANFILRNDVRFALGSAYRLEKNKRAKTILKAILDNAVYAKQNSLAICQDTGMPVVFTEVGQDVKISGDLKAAINKGIKDGYRKYSLRSSIVGDPLLRGIPKFSPCIIHTDIVRGNRIKLIVLPKGFGCENKSRLMMFKPTATIKEVKKFIIEAVKSAGADACPPYVVGVGIGGSADYASILGKKALLEKLSTKHYTPYAKLESDLLKEINNLNIGPMGLGGKVTALAVKIQKYPTHIAGLPVSVNISCHALRSAQIIL